MAKKIEKKVYQYTAIFEPDKESGGFTVTIPSLPGCISEGDTFEEAETMAKDAIEGYLKALKDLNEEIPIEPDRVIISKIPASL